MAGQDRPQPGRRHSVPRPGQLSAAQNENRYGASSDARARPSVLPDDWSASETVRALGNRTSEVRKNNKYSMPPGRSVGRSCAWTNICTVGEREPSPQPASHRLNSLWAIWAIWAADGMVRLVLIDRKLISFPIVGPRETKKTVVNTPYHPQESPC